jgi:Zn-finger nucleic acid-binding protein
MRQIQRYGIEIDVCPTTGGVWLDKGELEKLLAIVREAVEDEDRHEQQYRQQPQQQPQVHVQQMPPQQVVYQQQQPYAKPYKHYDDDDDYKYRSGYKKSKLKTILDIFD